MSGQGFGHFLELSGHPPDSSRGPLLCCGYIPASPEDSLTSPVDFAAYLRRLRAENGNPSIRQMERRAAYARTTLSDAFSGRSLPTWDVAQEVVAVLGGNEPEARKLWAEAKNSGKARSSPESNVPTWLTSVRSDVPKLVTGPSFAEACALALQDPAAALESSWELVRRAGFQLCHVLYEDLPGSWASGIIATFRRAEEDGSICAGSAATADTVFRVHFSSTFQDEGSASEEETLQVVFLAYRLAWQVRDLVDSGQAPMSGGAIPKNELSRVS